MEKTLSTQERILWFIQNYYETGMEYDVLKESFTDSELDNFEWYGQKINIPKKISYSDVLDKEHISIITTSSIKSRLNEFVPVTQAKEHTNCTIDFTIKVLESLNSMEDVYSAIENLKKLKK
jgi:ribosome-associated translation inhibitor RaiA